MQKYCTAALDVSMNLTTEVWTKGEYLKNKSHTFAENINKLLSCNMTADMHGCYFEGKELNKFPSWNNDVRA